MPKLRRHIYLSAIVLLLSSCIYDEMQEDGQTVPSTNEEQKPVAPQPIQLSATLLDARTRAADGENEGNFALETPVTVSVDGNNYSYKTDATSTSNPLDCQDAVPPYFPIDGSSVRIMAYYPSTMQYATTVRTFTVAHDQSQTAAGTANYKASDLMVGLPKADFADASSVSLIDGSDFGRKVKPTSLSIPLEFEHKMVKIRLNTTNNGATVRKVEMTGIKRSIDFNPSDTTFQNLATATDDTDATENFVIMYEDATGSTSNVVCTALIPKQDLTSGTPFITVTTASGTPLVYKLPENYYFAPGKQYRFNVNINDYEITATSDVTDWDDDTSFNMGDGLAVLSPIMKNPLWYVAKYNLNSDATFNKASSTSQGYLFSWNQAMNLGYTKLTTTYDGYDLPNTRKTVGNGESGATWHIPTHLEYHSIMPHDANLIGGYTANSVVTEVACTFGYNNDTKYGVGNSSNPSSPTGNTYKAFWGAWSNPVMYAIRFLDTDYCSVWRYKWYDSGTTTARLEISAKLIPKISSSETTLLASLLNSLSSETEDYWTENEDRGAVQRSFYCCGCNTSGSGSAPGSAYSKSCGYHWSTTLGGSAPYHLHFNFNAINMFMYQYYEYFAVRLFRDN